jgi:tellurite methyltransferase
MAIDSLKHDYDSLPSQFLVDHIRLLPRGRVLDVAMGAGRNAVYLARMGFEVEGGDISAEAVQAAFRWAEEKGLKIRAEVADLEKNYRIEPDFYDVIICFNYLQRSLMSRIKDGLKKGGILVYETYIIDQQQFGRPLNPDFLLQHNELLNIFRDFRCLRYREGLIEERKAIASLIAEKI